MQESVHVTFIHGLANKPPADVLLQHWLNALAKPTKDNKGLDFETIGISTSLVYWADLFYKEPLKDTEYESNEDEFESTFPEDIELIENEWTQKMLEKLIADEEAIFMDIPEGEMNDEGYENIPIPKKLKKRMMRAIVKEAHHYLFNVDGLRDKIRARVIADLQAIPQSTRHIIVGHSQGSFIAYDVLNNVKECKEIKGFLTLGSPLGIDEIQRELNWNRENGYPRKLKGGWVNVYDRFDFISRIDPKISNDFQKQGEHFVIDVNEQNWGIGLWARHSAKKYFQGLKLRNHLRILCNIK